RPAHAAPEMPEPSPHVSPLCLISSGRIKDASNDSQFNLSLVLNTTSTPVKHGACSTGLVGPRPRLSRLASHRGSGYRATIGHRRRAWTRPDLSPRSRARRAPHRRGVNCLTKFVPLVTQPVTLIVQ